METKVYTRPTRKRLKGFLGKHKFKKAEALLNSERALDLNEIIHTNAAEVYAELSGWVEDKSGKRRRAYAEIAADGTVKETSCSCGSDQPCIHTATMLLVHSDEPSRENAETGPVETRSGKNGPNKTGPVKSPKDKSPSTGDLSSDDSYYTAPEKLSHFDLLDNYDFYRDYEVRLDFEAFELQGEILFFRPLFSFSSPAPASKIYRDVLIEKAPNDELYDFRCDAARAVWADAELSGEEAALLAKSTFEMEDINRLRELIGRRSFSIHPRLHIDFPYHAYTLKSENPVPRVDIKEYREGISLKVEFMIGGLPCGFLLDNGFYPLSSTVDNLSEGEQSKEKVLSLVYVPESHRRRCWDLLRERLGSSVVREEPAGSRYHFTAKISASDFILESAAELIEEGWELRKQGTPLRSLRERDFTLKTFLSDNNWLEVRAGEMNGRDFEAFEFDPAAIESGVISRGEEFIYIDKKVIEKLRRLRLFGSGNRGKFKISPYNSFFWREFSTFLHLSGPEEEATEKEKNSKETVSRLEGIRDSLADLKNFTALDEKNKMDEPEGFRGRLRDYQKAGLAWLLFLRDHHLAGCLADDMGLGKTVQTLALLQHGKNKGLHSRALIVAPVSTLPNWHSEAELFTPGLSVYRYHGQERNVEELSRYDIVLTSYATLRNDIELFVEHEFSYLILDEAQAIKNAASKTFKAVNMLSAPHRLTLTGTPLENNLLELWAQVDFLLPGLLGSRNSFIERFVKDIEQNRSEEKTELLRSTIYPFILRRTKGLVAPELPDKEEITVYAEMEEKQAAFYHGLREHYRKKVDSEVDRSGIGKSSTTIFEALLRLRQAALFPSLLGQEYRRLPSCKFDLLKDALNEILEEGYKAVLFSQFLGTLERIRSWASEEKYAYAYLDGSTRKREEQITLFQEDPNVRLFLISLKAGGLGINLTAADYVILFDPWWNPAVERQAIDRVHRIGRSSKVIAYRYIVRETIEEKMLTLQARKRELAEEIITEERSLIKSLSREDLEYLFS